MRASCNFSVLLGAVGGDSHSVGLTILRRALQHAGYFVTYLGIQNVIDDFVAAAGGHDIAMISNMDGHAAIYLDAVTSERLREAPDVLWYLGGNITLGDPQEAERHFLAAGFHRVWPNFVDVEAVMSTIAQDLAGRRPSGMRRKPAIPTTAAHRSPAALPFDQERREVLASWPTGAGASDLESNARYLSLRAAFADTQRHTDRVLLQPRSGVASLDAQVRLFDIFARNGATALSFQVDSLTRNNDYGSVQRVLDSGGEINGFPVVNHGVACIRRVIESLSAIPVQTRHSTRDPRLLAEISYAGGVTAFEGGPICYNIPYYRDYPLRDSLRVWRYVDHLTALYFERYGIRLDREFFGTLTATLMPPSIAIACNVLEALFAAGNGVKCVSLAYAEQGHRSQDIAAIRVMSAMAREYLDRRGLGDVWVFTVFHQYMAGFPRDLQKAEELIRNSATTAALAGVRRIVAKSPAEPRGIPTGAENVRGLELAAEGVALAPDTPVDEERIAAEEYWIRREVAGILDRVLDGAATVEEAVVLAFQRGHLDIPFSPSVHNAGRVVTGRDLDGAVRFLDCGTLPFDRETRAFHARLAEQRRGAEHQRVADRDYAIVESDVLQIPRGRYDEWPLDGNAARRVRRPQKAS